jgi:hypothetical protein
MEDGKVDSSGEEPSSVSWVFRKRPPRNKHKKPRERNWRKWSPVVIILAVLAIVGTPYYLSRHSLTPAAGPAGPAGHPGVQVPPSQLSRSVILGEEQGHAPARRTRSTLQRNQQSSGISAIPGPASPGPTRHVTSPPRKSPAPALSPAAAPAVTPATPAAPSTSPAAGTATACRHQTNVSCTRGGAGSGGDSGHAYPTSGWWGGLCVAAPHPDGGETQQDGCVQAKHAEPGPR